MMETLKAQAGYKGAATGGHVFFAHFEREGRQYLLIAIVNEKLGASMTSDLDVQDVRHLDMDGFRFAGRINMTGWANGEERYIGFLKGKREVSEYFKEFLGCDTTVQNRRDTAELVQALMAFAIDEGMDTPSKDDFLARAKTICERSAKAQEELSFEALANELSPQDPERLMTVLADPDLRLNDGFVPDRRALGPLIKFKGKTPTWSIEFNRDAITRGNVRFNAEDNTLTLTGLPRISQRSCALSTAKMARITFDQLTLLYRHIAFDQNGDQGRLSIATPEVLEVIQLIEDNQDVAVDADIVVLDDDVLQIGQIVSVRVGPPRTALGSLVRDFDGLLDTRKRGSKNRAPTSSSTAVSHRTSIPVPSA